MRWQGGRQSDNVEDRRGAAPGGGGAGGGSGGRRLSLGAVVVVLIGSWLLGLNPLTVLSALDGGPDRKSVV